MANTPEDNEKKEVLAQYDNARAFKEAIFFEKTAIIAPALKKVFGRAVRDGIFDIRKDRIVDIGCGPFLLALPFLNDGVYVDGIDITPNMIVQAKETLEAADFDGKINKESIKLVTEYNKLASKSYAFAMLNFVHQTSRTEESLTKLFKNAHDLLKPGGTLVLTSTHPDYLHIPHAAYECDVKDSAALKDGDKFGGWLYDSSGKKAFRLDGDYFWSVRGLHTAAFNAGFDPGTTEEVDDHPTLWRKKSDAPAYLMMTFRKPKTFFSFLT